MEPHSKAGTKFELPECESPNTLESEVRKIRGDNAHHIVEVGQQGHSPFPVAAVMGLGLDCKPKHNSPLSRTPEHELCRNTDLKAQSFDFPKEATFKSLARCLRAALDAFSGAGAAAAAPSAPRHGGKQRSTKVDLRLPGVTMMESFWCRQR